MTELDAFLLVEMILRQEPVEDCSLFGSSIYTFLGDRSNWPYTPYDRP